MTEETESQLAMIWLFAMLSVPPRKVIWMAFCLLLTTHRGAKAQQLNSLISLSQIIASDPPFSTIGNVNIIEASDIISEPIPICYLPYLHSFTNDGDPVDDDGQDEGMAAILLAMEHLNTGNGDIVPELDGINRRCPLRFATKAFDTEINPATSVNHVISLTDRSARQPVPCAILGAAYSAMSIPTSIISGLRGVPQISSFSTSAELDDKSQFRLFGRTVPNDDGTAVPLVDLFASWNVKRIAVLHIDDSYGNDYVTSIRYTAKNLHPKLQLRTVVIAMDAGVDKISSAIKQLKETEYTYFFAVIYPEAFVDQIMIEAYNQGIAGTGKHIWLFSDSVGSAVTRKTIPIGSPLEKAYRGTGQVKAVGSLPGTAVYDKLARYMQQLGENERDRSFLADSFPKIHSGDKSVNHSIISGHEDFLKSPGVSTFLYDAVVLIGLSSCELIESKRSNEYFTGEELFQAILHTTFEGTTGSVILDPETGTRTPESSLFALTNFIDDEDANVGDGNMKFLGIESDLFMSGRWESLLPYTFNNGASDIPPDLPPLEINPNFLNAGLQAVGLILCGIVITMALGFSYWTFHNSKKGVVRASQPLFLYLISAGALLMGLSIIPFNIQYMHTVHQAGADAACMTFPWLINVGVSLTFSALFTKTYRIVQIMKSAAKFVRVKVTAADVMKPMIALLMLNIVILSIWTTIDPLERKTVVVLRDQFGRDQETFNICNSDHASIFVGMLSVINLGSLLFGLFQAYKARNISTEYQESSYIFMAMSFICIVSFIAVPIRIISRAHVAALYFVTVGLIFVLSASVLSLIFLPKVWALRERKRSTESEEETSSHWGGIKIIGRMMTQVDLEKELGDVRQEVRGTIMREVRGTIRQEVHSTQVALENEICELQNEVHELRLLLSKEEKDQGELQNEVHELRLLLSKEARDQGNGKSNFDENEVPSEAAAKTTASSSSGAGENEDNCAHFLMLSEKGGHSAQKSGGTDPDIGYF